jgi:NADH dehydrogenase [ubiquinone] 1 alpha subcomplex assembly factor 5
MMVRIGAGNATIYTLVPQAWHRHKREMADLPPQIFSTRRRMALRARALNGNLPDSFLYAHMIDELRARLAFVRRDFDRALFAGPIALSAERVLAERQCEIVAAPLLNEEAVPYPPESFDLIICAATLDSVNDLPGALIQMRRALRPDGLFLATLFGSGSLGTLKAAMLRADGDAASPHIHPQIDVRVAADLLTRTGFALPVCDLDTLSVRYGDWRTLVADLRAAGIGNALAGDRHYAGRDYPARLDAAWGALADNKGKVEECFNLLQLSGWAPSPLQPKPARRGSGQVSLADFLPKRD